jgi:protein-disulfide isomerase
MQRTSTVIVAVIALAAGVLSTYAVLRPAPQPNAAAIKAVVEQVLSDQAKTTKPVEKVAALDSKSLDPMIENYLMSNPEILQKASKALSDKLDAQKAEQARKAIASMHDEIFNDPGQVVLGNPKGDVTLVEMFDYNCPYCRQALPDLASLLSTDKNLRVVLKEFPILSQGSVDAARIAVLVAQSGADYWAFHEALFSTRGKVDAAAAWKAAESVGLDRAKLEPKVNSPEVNQVIQRSYAIAQALNITGTPSYIIGDEIIPGALGKALLERKIANMRACGKTVCSG